MKKIFYFLVIFYSNAIYWISYWNSIKESLLKTTESNIWNIKWDTTSGILSPLFVWFKTEIFSLIMVLAIAVFIFIGIKFSTAKWNPEEFKKAWLQLIYSIIWIFFIFMAWWLVRVVSSLNL